MKSFRVVTIALLTFCSFALLNALDARTSASKDGPATKPAVKAAPEAHQKLQDTLVEMEKRSWEAWKKRDGGFYKTFLSEDHVEVGASGTDGKAAIVAFVGSPVCKVKSYSVDNFKLTLFNETTALLTYHAAQDTVCHGPVPSPAWVSSLYVKRNGKWLNALYQQSPATK